MSDATVEWRVSPIFQVARLSAQRLLLLTEHSAHIVRDQDAEVLLALDSPRRVEWLTAAFGPEVLARLQSLRDRGFAVLAEPGRDDREHAYALSTGIDPKGARITWTALTRVGESELAGALGATGLSVTDDAPVLLVTTDDYLHPEIARIAARESRPWLLARPAGVGPLIGPLFEMGRSTCWFCFAHWLKPRRWLQAVAFGPDDHTYLPQPGMAATPATLSVACGLITSAAAQLASTLESPALAGTLCMVDVASIRSHRVVVPARVRCDCRGGRAAPASAWQWTNPFTGVASEVSVTDQPIAGLYHAFADHFCPRSQRRPRVTPAPGRAFAHGRTAEEAADRCLAEAVERYSTIWQGTEPMVLARCGDADRFIHPRAILQHSDTQYANRGEWNASARELFQVPEPFDDAMAIHWTPARSLRNGETRLTPSRLCYAGLVEDPGAFGIADSIGCAAGRTFEEAVLRALLEVVERDALSIWWYNRLRRPGVAVDLADGSGLSELVGSGREIGRQIVVLDVTTDLDIPAYVAVGTDASGAEPFFGCAAHPDGAIAARKAIGEMLQILFWSTRPAADPPYADWLRSASSHADPYLVQDGQVPLRRGDGGDAAAMLSWCVDRLARRGLTPYSVDLTRPETGLPVARVIVPGARHCWHRLGGGRLADVPVQMGWRGRALAEAELNPRPCPL